MEPILTDRAGVVEIDIIFNLGPLTQYAAKSVKYEFSQLVALPPTHLGTIKSFSTHSPIEELLTHRAGMAGLTSLFNLDPVTQYTAQSGKYAFFQLVALPTTH